MTTAPRPILPRFDAPYAEDDVAIARNLLVGARLTSERERRIDDRARGLIKAVRDAPHGFGSIEALLREYRLPAPSAPVGRAEPARPPSRRGAGSRP